MAIRVIGAGFGRTGTASLRDALEILGFEKCYHMKNVYKNGDEKKWLRKVEGENVSWDELLDGCSAGVDWPVAAYYEELAECYPDAKVILTIRDPDSWYRSMSKTIYPMSHLIPIWRSWFSSNVKARVDLLNKLIWDGTFHGRFNDADYAKSVFKAHNEAVIQRLPADRVLVYDVSQGWNPLCEFLSVPAPKNVPFPHKNVTGDRKRNIRVLWLQRLAPYILIGAASLAVLLWLV